MGSLQGEIPKRAGHFIPRRSHTLTRPLEGLPCCRKLSSNGGSARASALAGPSRGAAKKLRVHRNTLGRKIDEYKR